jgi:hypothetical protein
VSLATAKLAGDGAQLTKEDKGGGAGILRLESVAFWHGLDGDGPARERERKGETRPLHVGEDRTSTYHQEEEEGASDSHCRPVQVLYPM